MKKLIFIILTIIIALLVYVNVNADEIVIPSSAIRVRVIANANTIEDQSMKIRVKKYIDEYLSVKMLDIYNIETARNTINNELDNLNTAIKNLFEENNYNQNFIIHYGDNYFPEKNYKGTTYKSGIYESLVVTIGDGNGDNWWCVLFPPLCLLEAEENELEEVQYKFFVQKMLNKIFE